MAGFLVSTTGTLQIYSWDDCGQILKIGRNLAKLWTWVQSHLF